GEVAEWKSAGERRAENREENWFWKGIKRREGDKELVFDIVSEARNVSGFYFTVEGAGPLKWELGIGGAGDRDPVNHDPAHVKIGRDGISPPSMPFETFAHPDERGHGR